METNSPTLADWYDLPDKNTHAFLAIKYIDIEANNIDTNNIPPYPKHATPDPFLLIGTIQLPGQDEYFIYVDTQYWVDSLLSWLRWHHPSSMPNIIHQDLTPGSELPIILVDYLRLCANEE